MKKTFFLLTVFSLGIFSLAGCSKTAENTNAAANQNKEAVKKVLQPGDISPDKAVGVDELADGVLADENAWKGKEVSVSGYISQASGKGTVQVVLVGKPGSAADKYVFCDIQGDMPKVGTSNTSEIKGKIESVQTYNQAKGIHLESCELKK